MFLAAVISFKDTSCKSYFPAQRREWTFKASLPPPERRKTLVGNLRDFFFFPILCVAVVQRACRRASALVASGNKKKKAKEEKEMSKKKFLVVFFPSRVDCNLQMYNVENSSLLLLSAATRNKILFRSNNKSGFVLCRSVVDAASRRHLLNSD